MNSNFEATEVTDDYEAIQLAGDLARIERLAQSFRNRVQIRPVDSNEQAAQLLDVISYLREAVSIFLPISRIHVQLVPDLRVPYSANGCRMRKHWLRYCRSWCTSVRMLAGLDFVGGATAHTSLAEFNLMGGDLLSIAFAMVSDMQNTTLRQQDSLLVAMQQLLGRLEEAEQVHARNLHQRENSTNWGLVHPPVAKLRMSSRQQEEIIRLIEAAQDLVAGFRFFYQNFQDLMRDYAAAE